MSKRPQGTLLKSSQHHDRSNLELAREIIANPAAYIPLVVTWARSVVAQAESGQLQLALAPEGR